jgi:hypothetical protein
VIEPVRGTFAELERAWADRRRALREQDVAGAEEAQRKVLALQEELAIDNLRPFAAAEVRDSQRALAARLEADALAHAELAVRLAPDLPEAHLALARARLARDGVARALAALGGVARAAARDPHTARAVGVDVAAALAAAILSASAAIVALLLARRFHLFAHDFHDLPVVRAGTPVQGALLALVVLGLPLSLGLGPLAAVAVAVAAAWLYLSLGERIVATLALLAFVGAPFAAEQVGRWATFTGTLAEEVYELEHGAGDAAAARLAARGDLPPAALAALGRHAKRRGDLAGARRWLEAAVDAGGRPADVLVNLGNVHLLGGDLEAAKAAWLDAADRAGPRLEALAAAHYNLSKLYVRQSALDQANEARRRAQQVAPELVARRAAEDDLRANRHLVDVPLDAAAYRALAAADGASGALGEWARRRIAGALPPHLWPWAPLGLVAALWALAALGGRLRVARACDKCGRPACARCDAATGLLCGQCVNVYVKKGVVEARDRVRKDRQVRRRARVARLAARAAALLGGGPGHVLRGEPVRGWLVLAAVLFAVFLAVFHRGVLPPPQPTPFAAAGRLALAIPLGAVAWAASLRAIFRSTRG